jgi:putative hydrolase of the HAD superfamily
LVYFDSAFLFIGNNKKSNIPKDLRKDSIMNKLSSGRRRKMQKQNILFNLDDTLVYCNRYFNQAVESFAHQMTAWFEHVPAEEIKRKQLELDLESINEYGLSSVRFPESFVGTYKYFCELTGKEKKKSDIEHVRELGFRVFKTPVEPIPYMDETLQKLKEEGHELYLHTGGDEANQWRKITQLELTTYFEHRIFISEYKDTTALSDILKTIDADPKKTWMIGNSLRTDIVPALEKHINAIYIPGESEWKYDVVDVKVHPKGAFFTVDSLRKVPEVIHKYLRKEGRHRNGVTSHFDAQNSNKKEEDFYKFNKKF